MSIYHIYWLVPLGIGYLFWGGITNNSWMFMWALIGLVLTIFAVKQRQKEEGKS